MRIIEVVMVSLICVVFWFRMRRAEDTIQDRLGALFFALVYWAFYAVHDAVFTFPSERSVLNKDRASGAYRLSAYYLAKSSVDLPIDMLYPLLFTLMWYWAVGFNPSFVSFLLQGITMMLNVSVSLSIGVLLSAIFMSAKEGQVCGTMWILSSMLFSGYYIAVDNLPKFIRPLTHISYLKVGYAALVRIEARGQSFPCVPHGQPHTIYSNNGRSCPVDEQALLRAAQVDPNISLAGNLAILVLWIVGLRLIGYFALKYLNRTHKPKRNVKVAEQVKRISKT